MKAPRVLIILSEQWPRALLRAELRERGYDAQGAPSISDALVYPATDPEHGSVRLVIVDQAAVEGAAPDLLERLRAQHPEAQLLLLARAGAEAPAGAWTAVVHGPFGMDEVLHAVERLVPPQPASRYDPED